MNWRILSSVILGACLVVAPGLWGCGEALLEGGENEDGPISKIIKPVEDEIIIDDYLKLKAIDEGATDVLWAVRLETCEQATGTVAGNVDLDEDTDYDFVPAAEDTVAEFKAEIDVSEWEPGHYCFVFNPRGDAETNARRLTRWFYIAKEYAIIGGTLSMGKAGRGNSPTHAFDGLIASVSDCNELESGWRECKAAGSLEVNYRGTEKGEGVTCEFFAGEGAVIVFRDAPGIGIEDTHVVADAKGFESECAGYETDDARIIVLDRDADELIDEALIDDEPLDAPRGAIVLYWSDSEKGEYDFDIIKEEPGASAWYPLDRGNIHVVTDCSEDTEMLEKKSIDDEQEPAPSGVSRSLDDLDSSLQ